VFAGAVRETVFSRPEVIRRVNADFVPVAISPPSLLRSSDEEARLFQSIYRSRPADQGICVTNLGGQALNWVLMFDDEKAILAFLDHSLKRFREHPDGKQPVATERYMRFPSVKLEAVQDDAKSERIAERHPAGTRCRAVPWLPPGTVVAQVFGRALDPNGRLSAQTLSQERYAQDQFYVMPEMQAALAKAFAGAGTRRVRIPADFARLCVTYAYLGQTDVRPLLNPAGGSSDLQQCAFWAQQVRHGSGSTLMRVEGHSAVVSELLRREDGAGYRHEIRLAWEGFIELNGNRMTRLLLSGRGREKLRWGSEVFQAAAARESEVAHLPAGRPIDSAFEVRYGIVAPSIHADGAGIRTHVQAPGGR
jgi:hypothetical protein